VEAGDQSSAARIYDHFAATPCQRVSKFMDRAPLEPDIDDAPLDLGLTDQRGGGLRFGQLLLVGRTHASTRRRIFSIGEGRGHRCHRHIEQMPERRPQ